MTEVPFPPIILTASEGNLILSPLTFENSGSKDSKHVLGDPEGIELTTSVGESLGTWDGDTLGDPDPARLGLLDGRILGRALGTTEGDTLGIVDGC